MPKMKSILLGLPLLLLSCVTTEENVVLQPGEVISVEIPKPKAEESVVEQKTITGSFQSVEGVMDRLSCFCYHSGYVTTEDGERIAVCFEETVESCPKITVTGYQTSKKISENGACSKGIMGYLKVQSYVIGETDY
ncbi:MAG: hypothetical protein HWE22_14995 [Flavobacteriales bacterium]|nr:hypothetical protein [Flavobacteriales bacterium]